MGISVSHFLVLLSDTLVERPIFRSLQDSEEDIYMRYKSVTSSHTAIQSGVQVMLSLASIIDISHTLANNDNITYQSMALDCGDSCIESALLRIRK